MFQEQYQTAPTDHLVHFDPFGEHVDCVSMSESDLIMITAKIRDVRGKCYDNSEPDDCMMAAADAVRALANKGDVVFDYERSFGNEIEDLRKAQEALYERAGMHTLVGRSADRSTLFLVFAPTTRTQCVAVGRVKRRR